MDKILTKKILGLKVEDILKCVLLVGVGYCIAVMLGNCNCVEGLPFVCENTGPEKCTVENCNADEDKYCSRETCPGWQIDTTGNHGSDPVIYAPSLLYKCENSEGSDVGYDSIDECNKNKPTVQVFSSQRPPCPNPTYSPPTPPPPPPTPPPPPPPPPTPPLKCREYKCPEGMRKINHNKKQGTNPISKCCTAPPAPTPPAPTPPAPTPPSPPPSVCTYSGDFHVGTNSTPFNKQWWIDSADRCETCSTNITNCREDMQNYLKYVDGVDLDENPEEYKGFCIQTVGESTSGERGDCGRIRLTKERLHARKSCDTIPGSDACIDDQGQPIFIPDPTHVEGGPDTCKKTQGDDLGNMAWVEDSLKSRCDAQCPDPQVDCPTASPKNFKAGDGMGVAQVIRQGLGF